ncbi:MAG: hypothetical protein H6832_15540 [Planctomycetes bacterium]|nr:hypothetical protein [Planctomycetota bacterium]
MRDFILLMHDVTNEAGADTGQQWSDYFARLRAAGVFQGGSSIGDGICIAKSSAPPDITRHLTGYIRIRANDLNHAREFIGGNPVFEAGGTVEIRELPED